MKKIKHILPVTVMSLAIVGLTAGALSAYAHFGTGQGFDQEKSSEIRANHEAMQTALENNDYAAWQEAAADQPNLADKVNEETFAKMAEAHELMASGNQEEARAIMEELGLRGSAKGFGRHGGGMMNEEAQTALENNDYAAWQEAVSGMPIAEKITNADDFAKLVKIHELKTELGLGFGQLR